MTMSQTTFESPTPASQWRALGDAARAFATGLWAFPLATAGLAVLSVYRESLGL